MLCLIGDWVIIDHRQKGRIKQETKKLSYDKDMLPHYNLYCMKNTFSSGIMHLGLVISY